MKSDALLLVILGVLAVIAVAAAFLPGRAATAGARKWLEARGYKVIAIRRKNAHRARPRISIRTLWHVERFEAVLVDSSGTERPAIIEAGPTDHRVIWMDE